MKIKMNMYYLQINYRFWLFLLIKLYKYLDKQIIKKHYIHIIFSNKLWIQTGVHKRQ